jgi:peptidoglycan hydrolase FlgJ
MSLSSLTSVSAAVDFPSTAPPDAVARQVEGLFASLLLKEMRGNGEEGGLFGGDSTDVLGGMFDQYMGQAIADAGGLGLRDYLVAQARNTTDTPTASEPL